jgi:hypothetical protein
VHKFDKFIVVEIYAFEIELKGEMMQMHGQYVEIREDKKEYVPRFRVC